ncbi:MAG: hypothetical protein JWM14_1764 [Chitinophagaceae bacterium]|nr:hypothetical protein [Chitinophagaceae bacterium]
MNDTLDHFEENNKNFKRAKILLKFMALTFIVAIVFAFATRFIPLDFDTRDSIAGIPILVMMILAPIGLFYIAKSYIKKEDPTKRRLLYLLGIICFNLLLLMFIYSIVRDISQLFYK